MGEESMRLRDTPSPEKLEAGGDFGFGFGRQRKGSLTHFAPEPPRKKLDALRASCPRNV